MKIITHRTRAPARRRARPGEERLGSFFKSASTAGAADGLTSLDTHEQHHLAPPRPPLALTVASALSPRTPQKALWAIARERSDLRKWLIANPAASPQLLEFVAQAGGDHVTAGLTVLFENLEAA